MELSQVFYHYIFSFLKNLQAVEMSDSSKKECAAILEEYQLECTDVNLPRWREEIIQHAKGTLLS